MLDQHQSVLVARLSKNPPGTSHPVGILRHSLAGTVSAVVVLAAIAAGCIGWRVHRIEAARADLTQLGADYFWQHETYDSTFDQRSKWRQRVARWLGNPVASGLSIVYIEHGQPSDVSLNCLSSLREVRTLVLYSDQATDRTLAVISQLPKLRYLTLVGRQFTIEGLLQLRRSPVLERVNIDVEQLSPIEVAVLGAEVPGLRVASLRMQPIDEYQPAVRYVAEVL